METNILIESGTNELEVLEFTIGNNHYGINVAKIKEIVPYSPVTPVPNAHPSVEGIFMPRDLMITVVDLAKVIKSAPSGDISKDMFIITNFNKLNVAFHVHTVVGIHRVSWADIITPDTTISTADNGIATGIVKINGQLIIILDFERIVSDISPETGLKTSDILKLEGRPRSEAHIVIAEDSPLLIKLISDSLVKSGYDNLTLCHNGQEAWDFISDAKAGKVPLDIDCVITDLEMPLMDGHLNCLSELVEECGGEIDMSKLPIGDKTLSAKEIIANESQERMGLLIDEKYISEVQKIADRERAPMYVVGETTGDAHFSFKQADAVHAICQWSPYDIGQ